MLAFHGWGHTEQILLKKLRHLDERLTVAREELDAQDEFSEVIVNDRLGDAVDALERLVQDQMDGAVD